MRGKDGAIQGIISQADVDIATSGDMVTGRRGKLKRQDTFVGDIMKKSEPNVPLRLRPDQDS